MLGVMKAKKKKTKKLERKVIGVDTYAVIQRAVDEGVAYGWTRIWKYMESPKKIQDNQADRAMVIEIISTAVENSLFEFIFIPQDRSIDEDE